MNNEHARFSRPQKFVRGQVWIVDESPEVTEAKISSGDRTQSYRRPYLIMTRQEDLNTWYPIINCYPITTNTRVMNDSDIVIQNHYGEDVKVICAQLTSRDVKDFVNYMYTMPDDIMQKIDEITANRLGIYYEAEKIHNNILSLEKELDLFKKKFAILTYSINSKELKPVVQQSTYVVNSPKEEKKKISVIETDNSPKEQISADNKDVVKEEKKKTKIVWSLHYARQFLTDLENMPRPIFMKKYDIKNSSDLGARKQYANKVIKKFEEKGEQKAKTKLERALDNKKKKERMNAKKSEKEYDLSKAFV